MAELSLRTATNAHNQKWRQQQVRTIILTMVALVILMQYSNQ